MTTQNLTITNLMSDLVKRQGSDLHLTADSLPYFRIQGSIIPASNEIYKEEIGKFRMWICVFNYQWILWLRF